MARAVSRFTASSRDSTGQRLFAFLVGIFLAVLLVKLGNPVIFEDKFPRPNGILELIFQPWPFLWGYLMIAVLLVIGAFAGEWKVPRGRLDLAALLLPAVWLVWQLVSATQTVDVALTRATIKHFAACVICFYLGRFVLSRTSDVRAVIIGVLAGLFFVFWAGLDQHFGGLERTRQFFYEQPDWRDYPPDFFKKIASNRIYATLFYPNTLAAAILLFLPISMAGMWFWLKDRFTTAALVCLIGIFAAAGLANLYWSGSKSGWLLAMIMTFVALLHFRFNPALKRGLILFLGIAGLVGFTVKYAGFFERGATSVVARFDYWRAAVQTVAENPVFGTGPGTFFVAYSKVKRPEAEITRLCHNDYLEQASDSGIIGFLSFTLFIAGSLIVLYPKAGNVFQFSVWLGLLGVCLHSLMEFNLYIPAVSWPVFLLIGWLWGKRNQVDKPCPAS